MLTTVLDAIARCSAPAPEIDTWRFQPLNESAFWGPEYEIDLSTLESLREIARHYDAEPIACEDADEEVEFLRQVADAGGDVGVVVAVHFNHHHTAEVIFFTGRFKLAA